jgi:hypothetical protein
MGHGDRSRSPSAAAPSTAIVPMPAAVPPERLVNMPAPGKGVGKGGDPTPVPGQSTEQLVASVVANQVSTISSDLFTSIESKVSQLVTNTVASCTATLSNRVGSLEGKVDQLDTKVDNKFAELSSKLESIESALQNRTDPASTPGADNTEPTNVGFFRSTDPSILLLNTKDRTNVARAAIYESIAKLLGEAGIRDSDVYLSGDSLDYLFELKFLGNANVAKQNCSHFQSSLSLGRGKFKSQTCKDSNDQPVQFFCQPDKSPAQIRREILCKGIQKFLVSKCSSEIWIRKATATILVDKRPLVSIRVPSETSACFVGWNEARLISLKIEKAELDTELQKLLGDMLNQSYS